MSDIKKTWAVVYDDRILLEEETETELRKQIHRTRLPNGYDVCALPKPHGSVIL